MTDPILTYLTTISSRFSTLAFIVLMASATIMLILVVVYAMEDSRETREKLMFAMKITAVVLITAVSTVIFIPNEHTNGIVNCFAISNFKSSSVAPIDR